MWRRSALFTYQTLLYSMVTVLVLFALLLTTLRYLLPQLPDVTRQLEHLLAERYQVTATVSELSADWNRNGPQLVLQQLQVPHSNGDGVLLAVAEARIHFNFWQSLRSWSWQIERVTLDNAQFSYDLRTLQQANQGLAIEPLQRFFLQQLNHVEVANSTLSLTNLLGQQRGIIIDELRWFNQHQQHQGVGRFRIDNLDSNALDVMIRLNSADAQGINGQIYVHAEQLDIAPWLQQQMVDVDVAEAQLNFSLWLNVQADNFDHGVLRLGATQLRWQADQHEHQLYIADGAMRLRNNGDGWLLNSTPLTVEHNNERWELPPLSMEQRPGQWQLSMQQLPLAPLIRLLNPQADSADMAGLLSLKMRQRSNQPLQWQLQGNQLSWPRHGAIPGLQGVDLQLVGHGDQAQWQLLGDGVTLSSDALSYTHSWQLPRLAIGGSWQWHDGAWQLAINDHSQIALEGMTFALAARLQASGDDVEVAARVHTVNAEPIAIEHLRFHLPTVMGDDLHSYLNTALLGGEAEHIAMVWRGRLTDFPYVERQGSFAAQVNLSDAMVKFQPDWLPVYDTDIVVNFSNERMHIVGTDAQIGQMQLPRIDTVISAITESAGWLEIDAEVNGQAEQLQPVFAQSPLAQSVAGSLQRLQPSGAINGALTLRIPLGDDAAAQREMSAQGYVDFADNDLYISFVDQQFSGFSGRLNFNNAQLQADELRLEWQQLPLQVQLSSGVQDDAYQLRADFAANWPIEQIPEFSNGLSELMSGVLTWTSRLEVRLPDQGDYAFHWRQQTDLQQLALQLPQPLNKPMGTAWPTQVQVSGGPEHILINAELAEHGLLELQLNGDGSQVVQGYARAGESISTSPNANILRLKPVFAVDITTEALVLQQWLSSGGALTRWLNSLKRSEQHQQSPAKRSPLQPDLVQISSQSFDLYGYPLGPSTAALWPHDERGWQLDFAADNAAINGHIFHNDERIQVDLVADFIELLPPAIAENVDQNVAENVAENPADEPQVEALLLSDLQQFPQLSLNCKRCRYGEYNLGRVQIRLSPDSEGLWLQQLNFQQGRHQFNASGHWLAATAEQSPLTKVQGTFSSADLGAFLRDQNITTMVQDSPAEFSFDLSWQGTPFALNTESLDGRVSWRLGQGYLNEVSDGAARLFSLLSLEGLIRKLRFDFRDVFANGLFYTEFGGEFSLSDGIVSTNNTRLNGSAGDMEINGTVNLNSTELNYQIFYIPKVTSSLPVIVAWMVNPPTGLAALLIDRVLHDAQVISRLEYRITGTLDQPIVEEVARDSREVEIPLEKPEEPVNEQQPEPPAAATDGGTTNQ